LLQLLLGARSVTPISADDDSDEDGEENGRRHSQLGLHPVSAAAAAAERCCAR